MIQDNTLTMTNPNGHTNTVPLYFPVAMSKFVVMFIVTFSLYGFFWWYKTWQAMGNNSIRAILKSIFIYLTVGSFVTDLKQHLDAANVANQLNPKKIQFIYLGYFVLSIAEQVYIKILSNQAAPIVLMILFLLKLILGTTVLYYTFKFVSLVNQLNIAVNNTHLIDNKYTLKTFLGIAIAITLAISSLLFIH